jgi:hypothetical protein
MFKTSKSVRKLIGLVCITLLIVPMKAIAGLTEYSVVLALIAIIAISLPQLNLSPAADVVVDQLSTAVEGARAANIVGNSTAELTRLSKAIGAAQALMGMTSACSDCSEVRDALQQIIGQAALLRTRIAGASGSCNPNGIVQTHEECDPLAIPSGCPASPTAVTYCSDECRCEVTIAP